VHHWADSHQFGPLRLTSLPRGPLPFSPHACVPSDCYAGPTRQTISLLTTTSAQRAVNSELRNHGVIPAWTPKPRRIRLGEHEGIKPNAALPAPPSESNPGPASGELLFPRCAWGDHRHGQKRPLRSIQP
jgi:hypothetical protein